jgi:protein-S-isoprenylcysteine O-methyltransferase Ste14
MPALALALCLTYLALVFGLRSLLQLRQRGGAVWTSPRGRSYEEGAADALFVVGVILDLAAPLLALAGLLPLAAFAGAAASIIGVVAFLAAIALALWAQNVMGGAWRTWIDPAADDPLITSGPFRWVRHPVYTSMLAASLAVALIAPTVLAPLAIAVCLLGLELQTRRIEEPHLLARHGDPYRRYASRAGRFLPGLGRLHGRS